MATCREKGPEGCAEVAMGADQAAEALTALATAAASGHWLLLKNLHLVPAWLPALEHALHALETPAEGFRLWLTSEASPAFPAGLLEACLVRKPLQIKWFSYTLF